MNPSALTPGHFAERYTDTALRTLRLVRVFSDADMALRPGEGSMSTAEQVAHICASANFIRGLLEEEAIAREWFDRPFDCSAAERAVAALTGMLQEVRAAAAQASLEQWAEIVEPFGPEWRMSRGELAYVMMEHEIHHRGALHVYARVAGKIPPLLYAPLEAGIENEELRIKN